MCFVLGMTVIHPECFSVWKTMTLGAHKSLDALQAALDERGVILDSGGSVILHAPEFVLSAEEKELDLVLASRDELGFDGNKGVDHWDVLKRAHEIGLRICPPAVGPALALACEKDELKQRYGMVIAMPLMAVPGCNPQAFYVGYDENYSYDNWRLTGKDAVVLGGTHDGPDFRWHSSTTGVFVKLRR